MKKYKLFYMSCIEPWFKKKDQIWGKIGGTCYKIPVYRWEKYISPTIRDLGVFPTNAILERKEPGECIRGSK